MRIVVNRHAQNGSFVMFFFLAQTDEVFLFGLPVPLDDASVFGTGKEMLRVDLNSSDALSVSFVLCGFSEGLGLEIFTEILVQSILFSELNEEIGTN